MWLPVHYFPLPLPCNHVQQGLPEVVSDTAVTNHLISKNDKAQVVDIFYVVLLHIHPVLRRKGNNDDEHVTVKMCFIILFSLYSLFFFLLYLLLVR